MITALKIGNEMLACSKVRIMTHEEAEIMLQLLLLKDFTVEEGEDAGRAFAMARLRLRHHKVDVHDRAILMAASLCDRPGPLMLYCAALKAIAVYNDRQVSLDDFINSFPMGFPIEAELHRIWDMQKRSGKDRKASPMISDNWLDADEAWR